jgi:hypothetical protein
VVDALRGASWVTGPGAEAACGITFASAALTDLARALAVVRSDIAVATIEAALELWSCWSRRGDWRSNDGRGSLRSLPIRACLRQRSRFCGHSCPRCDRGRPRLRPLFEHRASW